ncbi:MAG: class I SAM-dependent methyltransferase [Acidimicrobiia bacterium]
MTTRPDDEFMSEAESLEAAYLASDDPVVQSGFHGGRERWVTERSPLVEGFNRDGEFLDVGCANGLLASDVVYWAMSKGYEIVPYGIDLGAGLVALARERLKEHAENFSVADAWTWRPGRQWTFVYSLLDLSPTDLWCEWLRRLYGWVEPGGHLIVASYGSRSRGQLPVDVNEVLSGCGFEVAGSSSGGQGPVTRFGWVSKTE